MRIFSSGRVTRDLYVAGPPGMPVYLIDAPRPALFDAGMTVFSKGYVDDIRSVLGARPPAYLFLTHAHFDHVGAIGYFKETWPDLQIVASQRCREILQRPGAVQLITTLNASCIFMAQELGFAPIYEQPFISKEIDCTAEPDQRFDLGSGLTVQAIYAPGHTRDFMTYYLPARKILISSEAAGCDDGSGGILPEFLVDVDIYLESIARFSELDVDTLCTGHKLVLTGEDARSHLSRSPESTLRYLAMVEAFLSEEKGNIDAVAARVKAAEWDLIAWPKQPEQAYMLNTRQRVLKIWERIQSHESDSVLG